MAAMAEQRDGNRMRARRASIVILVAFIAWMAFSALGGALGLPVQLSLVLDAACLAALGWSIWELAAVWRAGRGGSA